MEEENEILSKRLKILDEDEVKLMYDRPIFSEDERDIFFDFSKSEIKLITELRSLDVKINFILQMVYFKVKHRFFSFELKEVLEDIEFIVNKYFKDKHISVNKISDVTKKSRLENQRKILNLFKYKYFGKEERIILEQKANISAKIYAKPVYIFRDLCLFLEDNRIIAPGYSYIQDLIGNTLDLEEHRLNEILEKNTDKKFIEELDSLLLLKNNNYEITSIRKSPIDFRYAKVRKEINRGNKIRLLYKKIQSIVPLLMISNESVKYYGYLVDYYCSTRLNKLDIKIVRIYLICFLYHRYNKINDNLINSMIHHVRAYDEESKHFANEKILEYRMNGNKHLPKAGKVLRIFIDKSIPNKEIFSKTKSRAFKLLDEDKLSVVADYIENKAMFDDTEFRWEYIQTISKKFKLHLRHIILNVEFGSTAKKSHLLEAVNKLKQSLSKGKGLKADLFEFKESFIPKKMHKYLYLDKKIIPDRYEFLIYKLLCNYLESGDIYCSDSIRFKSFESELITEDEWKNKNQLINDLGISILKKPIHKHLQELEAALESKIKSTNKKIENGENKDFEMNKTVNKSRWHLNTPTTINTVNHKIFESLIQVDISDVLYFTEKFTEFMEPFEHTLGRYVKTEADDRTIMACLISWATNMGLTKMGEISDIGFNKLSSISESYFRLETLQNANNKIIEALSKLEIFCQYHINDVIHSSTDGQKLETKISTINSRHSPKYFGLKKGVVSYTLVANHIPISAKIIGANEHESHHVFDILYNNSNDIRPDIHSTDTHGTNNINFAILHVFNYKFAPRYKNFYAKFTDSLVGFKYLQEYKDLKLKPKRKINTKLILEEWDNIQKIILSLGVKKTTQSIITGKLSSYARRNKTKKALCEYNNIIESIYLLDYVDSPSLRQNVQRALNRGESYHQLRRAISYANFGKLKFKTEEEQQLWNECARLISNAVIFYNESIFSNLLESKILSLDMIKSVSPVAWQHINFFGRYEFTKKPNPLDLEAIVKHVKKPKSL